MQRVTGLCRQSIAAAVARLETAGVLVILRRLCRQRVTRTSPWTGLPEEIETTTQATSLYRIGAPGAYAAHLRLMPSKPAPFPSRKRQRLGPGCVPAATCPPTCCW